MSLEDDAEYAYFDVQVKRLYNEAIKFVAGGKLYGIQIDTENLEEVIAALYTAYQLKENMVKVEGLNMIDCPKCGNKGLASAYLPMCTNCANKERGLDG